MIIRVYFILVMLDFEFELPRFLDLPLHVNLTSPHHDLVLIARESYKRLFYTLKLIGSKENKSDLCLLSKWTQDGVIMIGTYIDNRLVKAKRDRISELIVELKKSGFNLKIENNLTDDLSC
jgi:hypothetical protein